MLRPALCFALLSISAAAFAADLRSDSVEKTFKAADGGRLVIETDRGSLAVSGHDSDEVRVTVNRKVVRGSDSAAAEVLKDHKVEFSQDGGVIRVICDLPGTDSWGFGKPQLEIDIQAQVPRRFNVEATTAGGSVTARQIKGAVLLKTSGGSLHIDSIEGSLQGKTSGGSIRASDLSGEIDLHTSGGSISIDKASGSALKANTSGGSIRLVGISSPADVKTSGGSIEVEATAGPLTAGTSGGSIRAEFSQPLKGDVVLKTSAGGITVALPGSAAVNLDASTSAGSVRSDFAVDGGSNDGKDRSSLKGSINGGGPALRLRTSAGSIKIRRQ
ncbi:MAG: DUF4097 family beta strand repeat protein [Verrucomicrobiales bacterium]|nr:DUF4097 family beta strand repeat protein [Verrucomicrobiales bacterium]